MMIPALPPQHARHHRSPTEADVIAARIASRRKWERRRMWLRLHARMAGRPNKRPI